MSERADLNQNVTVKGGPSLDVKKVSQVVLNYPKFDVNADNRTLESKGTAQKSGTTGSQGDVARKTLDELTTRPAPRKQMTGQRNSKFYDENGDKFKTFPGNTVDQMD